MVIVSRQTREQLNIAQKTIFVKHMYLKWDEQTIKDFSPENINTMYDRGFVFTRPSEGHMEQTRSVRIDLSAFELSSENRRILRKTEGLELHVQTLPLIDYDWTIGKLAKDFYETKFGPGVFSANKVKELLIAGRKDFNRLFVYTLNGESVGYCIAVETPEIIHYSYPFYNLETVPKDMGLGMMTRAILSTKENGKKYIYLGGLQRQSDTYKLQFNSIEWFSDNKWFKQNKNTERAIENILKYQTFAKYYEKQFSKFYDENNKTSKSGDEFNDYFFANSYIPEFEKWLNWAEKIKDKNGKTILDKRPNINGKPKQQWTDLNEIGAGYYLNKLGYNFVSYQPFPQGQGDYILEKNGIKFIVEIKDVHNIEAISHIYTPEIPENGSVLYLQNTVKKYTEIKNDIAKINNLLKYKDNDYKIMYLFIVNDTLSCPLTSLVKNNKISVIEEQTKQLIRKTNLKNIDSLGLMIPTEDNRYELVEFKIE